MSRADRKHTAFVTVDGLYCYVVMPYGLKNALPTFVRAMSKTFRDLIRDRVEVYVRTLYHNKSPGARGSIPLLARHNNKDKRLHPEVESMI